MPQQKEIKEKIENWEKEIREWIYEIYDAHETSHSYGNMENYYVEKIRQLLKSEKEKLLERIKLEKYINGRRKGELGQITDYSYLEGYNEAIEDLESIKKELKGRRN